MVTRIRNRGCVPYLNEEGAFTRPICEDALKKDVHCEGTTAYHRMHKHHTLASARRYAYFKPFNELIPADQLDFALSSCFDQSEETFPDEVDVYLQRETLGINTWRRLRNTRDLTPDREEQAAKVKQESASANSTKSIDKKKKRRSTSAAVIPYRYNFAHKLLIGGVTEKKHPSNVKLMNSSHHSPQTNAGYSRQPSDGNVYQY